MRSRFSIAAVVSFMALVSVATALVAVGQIERLARTEVRQALESNGMDWIDVNADGLRVILSGAAPDEATRHRALRLAGIAATSALIVDEMDVESAKGTGPRNYFVEFLRHDGEVLVLGVVPASLDRSEVTAALVRLTDGAEVRNLLASADYPAPQGWTDAFEFSITALKRLEWSRIGVRAGRVEIRAIAESVGGKSELEAELGRDMPERVDLVLDISAPRPVIAPFTLRFLVDENGGRFDACSARDESGGKRIVSAAVKAGLKGEVPCRIGFGAPSPEWTDAAVAGIAAVARFGSGSVTFSDIHVSLIAPAETEQTLFERVVGELDAALPDVFSLTAVKSDPKAFTGTGEREAETSPEFLATISTEGTLLLRGRMTDGNLRDTVEGLARALFPGVDVRASLRLDQGLPHGWAKRVFAGLKSLSLLVDGTLVVQPKLVDIRGIAHDPDASDEISRILSAALGAAEMFAIEVNYVEPEDTGPAVPTPEECVAGIGAILDSQKIIFQPGSSEIGQDSFPVIDRIAEVMDGCFEVRMEIAGHTDSQGREEMNLRLSQWRAESVLNALEARRVLTGNLIPTGYGETRPIADNGTREGREENRRIEFTLMTDGEAVVDGGTDNEQN